MMNAITGASFLTAFVAGVAALFAPCCITVLLPTYLGSIFKQKAKLFLMTFVFFLGIAAVFVPLGLGFAGIGQLLTRYHNTVFSFGALMLVGMGVLLLLGKSMSLPWSVHPQLKGYSFGAIFVLGVFSGLATTCCAPVLAGVLALSVLPGSILWGGLYSLTYVIGMVAPLFLISLFLDKVNLTKRFYVFRRQVSYTLLGQRFSTSISNLVAGTVFLAFGIWILYLAAENRLLMGVSPLAIRVNVYANLITERLLAITQGIPNLAWGALTVLILITAATYAVRQLRTNRQP